MAVALAALGPGSLPGPDLCLFHRFTGHACPACGLTRAAAAAARGELGGALRFHPLLPIVALEIALVFALWARHLFSGRAWPRRAVTAMALATAALFLAVWIARFFAGSLPA